MTILGYVRVSTTEQAAENRTSLGEQERVIRGIGMSLGAASHDILIFSDGGVSGSVPLAARPAGKDLMDVVRPGDTVIASKFDRMFRSTIDALQMAEHFRTHKINLILVDLGLDPVTSSGIGGLFFTIVGALATFERERIKERLHDGMRAKKERGGCISGHPPYGWRKQGMGRDSVLVLHEPEQTIIRRAANLARVGHDESNIVRRLTQDGHRDRKGSEFRSSQVRRMLATAREVQSHAANP